jgi:surface protein
MINTREYSNLECDCGILVNFNPVFSVIPPSGNGMAPEGATPNISLSDTYILNFSVNSVSPSGSVVTLSPETYTIHSSRIFIPTTTAKINSRYKVNTNTLLKLVITDIYNQELYTDYTEILCLPDVIIRQGSATTNSNDESGQIISIDSTDLEVGMNVTGTNINGTATISEIIDRRTIRITGSNKSLVGIYGYKFTKSACEAVLDTSPSYIYLNKKNNWSYTYNGQLIAKFVPTDTSSNIEITLPAKNTRLPSKNSFYKIPSASLFKLVGLVDSGNSSICDNETCPSVLGQLIYDGDSYSEGDEITVTYDGFTISGPLKSLLTQLSESPYVTPTVTPSVTPSITPSITVTRTSTVTPTVTRTPTVTPTLTPSITPTITVTRTITPTVTITPTITVTPTVSITVTPTITPTISLTPTITVTSTISPTPTITITPSRSASPAYYIYAWGDNTNGEYGTGNTIPAATPLLTDTNSSFVKFACGDNHTLAINSYGELYAWGSNTSGQLGDGTTDDTLNPIRIGTSNDWVDVQTSINNSFAINSAGKIYTWGASYGSTPVLMLGTWKKMSVGGTSMAMISMDNKLYTFDYGGLLANPIYQIQVGTNSNWSNVSMGNNSLAAINRLGQLYLTFSVGFNGYGYTHNLIKYGSDTDWSSVVSLGGIPPGDGYTNASMIFALKTTGEIYYYGTDWFGSYNGLFGYSNFGYINTMTKIGTSSNWTQIFGVMNNTASNRGIFRLYAINSSNQLYGFGNTTNLGFVSAGGFLSSPTGIGEPNWAWITINPGRQHSLGIVSANLSATPTPTVTPTITVTPTLSPCPIDNTDPYSDNVSLLLHFNGPNNSTSFVDSSQYSSSNTITRAGNAKISTDDYRFDNSSLYIDGVGDYLQVPANSSLFGFGTGDFTVEAWIKILAYGSYDSQLFTTTGGFTNFSFSVRNNGALNFWNGAGSTSFGTSSTVPLNKWTHVAFSRTSGTLRAYVDGNMIGSISSTSSLVNTLPVCIGATPDFPNSNTCYIDELRVTKGVGRYTSQNVPYHCPSPDPTPTPTITITPTITPTISITPTITPTVTITPTITPTISVTPTITPTITVTKTVTPTITLTKSLTPTPTATPGPTPFVSTWNTTLTSTGSSNNNQVTLPLLLNGTYNFTVDWGDGIIQNITAWDSPLKTHTYITTGVKTISIRGTLRGWEFLSSGDCKKITSIVSWGPLDLRATGSSGNFSGCSNLVSLPVSGGPVLPINCSSLFEGCSSLRDRLWYEGFSLRNFDTSLVTNMSYMFAGCSVFAEDFTVGGAGGIKFWNTSSVTNMTGMFQDAKAFNSDISSWNVSSVTNMAYMFAGATAFNHNITLWNTSSVSNMSSMFLSASSFNQNLASLNISAITNMSRMLYLSGISQANYHNLLIGWGTGAGRTTRTNVPFGISQEFLSTNSSAVTGRSYLQSSGWIITDHGNEKTTILSYTGSSLSGLGYFLRYYVVSASATSENRTNNVVLDINWGDGTGERVLGNNSADITHNYSNFGTYNVRITFVSSSSGSYFQFGSSLSATGHIGVIPLEGWRDIIRFGAHMRLVDSGFYFFRNLQISATDQPLMPLDNKLDYYFQNTNLSSSSSVTNLINWNTSGIVSMNYIFQSSLFTGDLRNWNFNSINNTGGNGLRTLVSVPLSAGNYSSLLVALDANTTATNITLGVGSSKYLNQSSVINARSSLISRGWTITDGGIQ